MREFRNLDPGESLPDNPGDEVFTITAWSGGIIGLSINEDLPISLSEIAGIVHDLSTSIAKYLIDRHEKAKEN